MYFSVKTLSPDTRESLQLVWLARIRWAAIAVLLIIFCGADYALSLGLNWLVIIGLVSVSLLSNIALTWYLSEDTKGQLLMAGAALVLDVVVLSALLYMTGGYSNPLSMVFLVYVTLAAFFLTDRWAWGIFGLSLACFSALFFFHIPLDRLGAHAHHSAPSGFSLHLHGMLIAFALLGFITTWFVTRMNRAIAQQAAQIVTLQKAQDERDRLLALATLTAGAAHELATPISTISLIGDDLEGALRDDPRWADDVRDLRTQAHRCADILHRMRGKSGDLPGEIPSTFKVSDIISELGREFSDRNMVQFHAPSGGDSDMRSLRRSLVSALHALIRNGLQACVPSGQVVCVAEVDPHFVSFVVRDSGTGMSEDVRRRAGEPFFTSKQPGEGMGLGLFVTRLFALQVGGTLKISSVPGKGSEVCLRLPKMVRL